MWKVRGEARRNGSRRKPRVRRSSGDKKRRMQLKSSEKETSRDRERKVGRKTRKKETNERKKLKN